MQDLKALKRYFHVNARGGNPLGCAYGIRGPPRYDEKNVPHRRARACPSPCLDREENGLGLRVVFARIERSRGTGPRATVGEAASLLPVRAQASPNYSLLLLIL